MKKILLLISAIAGIAAITSCTKICHCTNYVVGEETTMDYTLRELQEDNPNEDIQKCSDVDHTGENAGILIGMKCK